LNRPVRAYNSLRRVGIHTVDELSARTEGELLAIENLGPQSVSQIKQRLADLGLGLAQPGQGGQAAVGAGTAEAGTAGAGDGTAGSRTGEAREAAPAAWADGAGGTAAPRGARPPDEDAIDLLSVAGFPVLKRALPVAGAVVALLLVVFGVRRRGRRRAARRRGPILSIPRPPLRPPSWRTFGAPARVDHRSRARPGRVAV